MIKNDVSFDVLYFVLESVSDKITRRHIELEQGAKEKINLKRPTL
jgi:hypothetical protein